MKCLFLYNPVSGRGKTAKKLDYIRKRLETKYEVEVVATVSGQDVEEHVRAAVGVYDLVVFSGGDGTFNNVLQGVGEGELQLGYLPSGTVNDVAHTLGIPRSIKGALNVILNGRSERVDCMRVGGSRYAMYIAAAGTLTSLTYETKQRSKRFFGWFAYVFHGMRHNLKFQVFRVKGDCDGQPFDLHSVLTYVMNGRSIAGFIVNRSGSMRDGKIEFASLKQVEKPNFFQKVKAFFLVVGHMFFGVRKRSKNIIYIRGERVHLETDESILWNFDGEVGVRGAIDVEVLPGRVKIFVPNKKRKI